MKATSRQYKFRMLQKIEDAAIDAEVASLLARGWEIAGNIQGEKAVDQLRSADKNFDVNEIARYYTLKHVEKTIQGRDGNSIILSIYRPMKPDVLSGRPGIYYVHSGGMTFGNRFYGLSTVLPFVLHKRAVCVAVEYRLAPEHRAPAALNDCYDALKWVGEHLDELGIHQKKLLIVGRGAGGALAAGTVLQMRDNNEGPELCGMMLNSPMLDDRTNPMSMSSRKNKNVHWTHESNVYAWQQVLGNDYNTDNVSPYIAPARATDLSRLPPTYIDVGEREILVDEVLDFATKLQEADVKLVCRCWKDVYHCQDIVKRKSKLRSKILQDRFKWMDIMMLPSDRDDYLLGVIDFA
ncbi:hypothetical protein VTN49DRAFT_3157 [Thermomyces lanuginosus]|uniref:uncharacterized protein n=1 Tax=Thermomyces lanuginosus TaxID=5541 RepID=UPI0037427EEF